MSATAQVADWRPSTFDVHTGWVHGIAPAAALPRTDEAPIDALEAVLLSALRTAHCKVAFSGGRDSSAVLAVATRLARREGLPDPVPVTEVYPGVPEADESQWQRRVLDCLGISVWERVEFGEDHDLVGPGACAALSRHGLMWPPAALLKGPLLRSAAGGVLITGEGGDEVFGARRITPLVRAVRWRSPSHITAAATAAMPGPLRARRRRRELAAAALQPWLRPDALRRHLDLVVADAVTEPLHWGESVWWLRRRRGLLVGLAALRRVAADHDATVCHPLLEPRVLAALARDGGTLGFTGRTEVMLRLFGDVLPQDVLQRRTKAQFNGALAGRLTRDFARRWDGSGVDAELVDVDRLRAEWLEPSPSALSFSLLHLAWLTSEGRVGHDETSLE